MKTAATSESKLRLLEDPDFLVEMLFQKLFANGYRRAEVKVPGFEKGVSNGRVSIGTKKVKEGIHVFVGIPISGPETKDLAAYDYRGLRSLYSRNPAKISNSRDLQEKMAGILELAQCADVHFVQHYDEAARGKEIKDMQDTEAAVMSILGSTMTPVQRIQEKVGRIRGKIFIMLGTGMAVGLLGSGAYFDVHRTGEFIRNHPDMVGFKDDLKENFDEGVVKEYERLMEKAEKEGNLKDKILVEMASRLYGLALGFPMGVAIGTAGAGAALFYRRKKGQKYVDQL